MIPLCAFLNSLNYHSDTEDKANESDGNEPARVMDEPSKVESELFAIVVLDEIEWLHIL